MEASFTPSWRSHFASFAPIPTYAASIGQVHIGVLAADSSPTGREEGVAIKVQFPNIAKSISSDLGYLKFLLSASALLPKGLFLDNTIKVRRSFFHLNSKHINNHIGFQRRTCG
jgi:aarF domain-containing kinase